jgi:hypothetical protein
MTTTKEKPAVKQPASKPAAKKPATTEKAIDKGVGLKDLAADLGDKDPKTVRARIRRIKGGAQVGQGGRYRWESKSDPEYKELLKELTVKESE